MSVGLRIFLVFVVLSMTLPTLWMAYTFLFPNYPPSLSPSDTAKVQSVFFGGSPAVVLCENSTTLALAGPAAVSLARELGIPSYRLDCTAKLGGGKFTTFERLSVEPWNPAAFVVANGRKVQQLPPGFTEERVLQRLAKSLVPRIKAKHTRVDNSVDLNRCLGQAGQACILVYNSKPKSVTAGEIAGAVATHRTSVIASARGGAGALVAIRCAAAAGHADAGRAAVAKHLHSTACTRTPAPPPPPHPTPPSHRPPPACACTKNWLNKNLVRRLLW